MADREMFLRAVIEAPDDDRPRLVFADWLAEHDQEEWAEFIRLQCRLESSSQDSKGIFEPGERARAEEQVKQMQYAMHKNSLLEPFKQLGLKFGSERFYDAPTRDHYYLEPVFRRGFVEELTLWGEGNVRQFNEHAAAIFRMTPLKTLVISDVRGQAECWDWGGPAGYWDCEFEHVSDSHLRTLFALPELAGLRVLNLWFDLGVRRAGLVADSPSLPVGTTLLLHNCDPAESREEVERILTARFGPCIHWVK